LERVHAIENEAMVMWRGIETRTKRAQVVANKIPEKRSGPSAGRVVPFEHGLVSVSVEVQNFTGPGRMGRVVDDYQQGVYEIDH
jgi:hypothetical protein